MATPYLQLRLEEVTSTQDVARTEWTTLPVVVIAPRQSAGRGRSGSEWITAPRALALSIAFKEEPGDDRPLSLMAGVAATRAVAGVALKWPNDVMLSESKVGGILVEVSGGLVVVGLGINLWWEDAAPEGMGGLFERDPGTARHAEIGALWAAEFLGMVDSPGWPRDEYISRCATLGRRVGWQPAGEGVAVGIGDRGELVVEEAGERRSINAGAIQHLRH